MSAHGIIKTPGYAGLIPFVIPALLKLQLLTGCPRPFNY